MSAKQKSFMAGVAVGVILHYAYRSAKTSVV